MMMIASQLSCHRYGHDHVEIVRYPPQERIYSTFSLPLLSKVSMTYSGRRFLTSDHQRLHRKSSSFAIIPNTSCISEVSSSCAVHGHYKEPFASERLHNSSKRSFGLGYSERFATTMLHNSSMIVRKRFRICYISPLKRRSSSLSLIYSRRRYNSKQIDHYHSKRHFETIVLQHPRIDRKHSQYYLNMSITAAAMADSSFELCEGQSRSFHELPSGLKVEVIQQLAEYTTKSDNEKKKKPPIVFLHGSYHAAWCWAVHWLPFFSSKGHNCYALSFLGQGESDIPSAGVGGTLQSHARDVAHFIRQKVPENPVLVGHSFGGLIVQQYLAPNINLYSHLESSEVEEPFPRLTAAILVCSVPPTGNGPLVQRYLRSRPLDSIKVTLSLAAKAFAYSKSLCRETFFSRNMPLTLVHRYQQLLAKSSNVPLFNLRELNASLPVEVPAEDAPPILVIGAENDFVVDIQGLHDTADVYGNNLVVVPSIAHDIMLDVGWNNAADVVATWLEKKSPMDMQAEISSTRK